MLDKIFKCQLHLLQQKLKSLMMMIGEIETCHEVLKWDKRLCLTLCTNKIGIIKWYVDASYTINDDCRGHTGAMMTL